MSKTTAVGYARRSTDMQERSIPDQQASVEQWAKEHGYIIKRWYVDDAISGTSTRDRGAFEQMMSEAENGRDFDAVLCYDMSRFSRGGTNETGYFLHRLKMVGVEVIFPAEGIPEGDEGELLMGVKSWQARQYSVKLSRDSIRGQISSIMARRSAPGGAPPLGYDKQHVAADGRILRTLRWLADGRKEEYDCSGRLVRVLSRGETVKKVKSDIIRYVPSTPDRVATIKRIFETAAAGYGGRYTANRLNLDGITTADGQKWSSNQVRKVITNPAYRGALAWNKRTMGKLHGVGRDGKLRPRKGTYGQRNNAQADWFVVESVHEPLVSPKLFEEVQRIMATRRHMNGAAKTGNRALLSGLIICMRCGWHFCQWSNTTYNRKRTKRDRYRYYVDRGYHTGGKAVCTATNIPADALEAWVIARVKAALLGNCETTEQAIEVFVKLALSGRDRASDTAGLEKDLETVNKRIRAMMSMLADPSFDGLEELKGTLADLKSKREALQARLDQERPSAASVKEVDLRTWAGQQLDQLDKLLKKESTIIEARMLIQAIVLKIEVHPETRTGVLFIQPDLHTSYMRSLSTLGTLQEGRGEG